MIKKFFLGVFLGCATIVILAPYDSWIKEQAGDLFMSIFADTFQCKVEGQLESFSLIPARLTMKDFTLQSHQENQPWQWKAQRYSTGFSWLYLFFGGAIDMWVCIEGLHAQSGMDADKPAIMPHLQDLLKGPDLSIPLVLKEVEIKDARFVLDTGFKQEVQWRGNSRKIGNSFRSQFYLLNGEINDAQSHTVAKNISGTIAIDARQKDQAQDVAIRLDGRLELPDLGAYPTCFVTGHWRNGNGRFQLQSIDQSLRVFPLKLFEREDGFHIDASATIPLSYLTTVAAKNVGVSGSCTVQLNGSLHPQGNGVLHFISEDLAHPVLGGKSFARGSLYKKGENVHGVGQLKAFGAEWHHTLSWNGATQQGTAQMVNQTPLVHDFLMWLIPSKKSKISMAYDGATHKITSALSCSMLHKIKETNVDLSLDGMFDAGESMINGTIDTYQFSAISKNDDGKRTAQAVVLCPQGKKMAHCSGSVQNATFEIELAFIRALAHSLFQIDMQAEGAITGTAQLKNNHLYGALSMKDATIRLPQTLNFVEQCSADFSIDLAQKTLILSHLLCGMHSGTISSPHAVLMLGDMGDIRFMHMPLLIDHCLFSLKHDLFAMISGALQLHKQPAQDFNLTGHIVLDRSQLKENLFSGAMQRKLLASSDVARQMPALPIECDIIVETKEPIRVDTNFLQANAQVALHVQDRLSQPRLSGTVVVPSGSILFPYKPLHITKAEITFLPDQPLNPIIEISAKNKIKNHQVALHVTGSLNDHMILLDATPPLTEEQIVSLLVAGAHNESLQAVIPTLLMHNITNFIFSSHKSNFYERHIKPWMKQINVQLMPNFTEQSGRGGLRGALEITVNDRWRALIEKNFSLTEDTRFELEYMLSDEVTFRAIRDERSDIGAEVEMKWKF